jgi:hypothetical protein
LQQRQAALYRKQNRTHYSERTRRTIERKKKDTVSDKTQSVCRERRDDARSKSFQETSITAFTIHVFEGAEEPTIEQKAGRERPVNMKWRNKHTQ